MGSIWLNVIGNSFGALVIGVLLALLGTVLMFWLLRSWRKDIALSAWTLLGAVALFVALAFQMVMLCGAVVIKDEVNAVEARINAAVERMQEYDDIDVLSTNQSQQLLNMVTQEFPIIASYVNLADFRGHTPQTVGRAMADTLRAYLNGYMIRRAGWTLFFLVATVLIVLALQNLTRGGKRQGGGTRPARGDTNYKPYNRRRAEDDF